MAITIVPLGLTGALRVLVDTDCDATAELNVNDGAATVITIEIDNTLNGAISYFKAWNNANPVVGTTAPDLILRVNASVTRTFVFPAGLSFVTALSYACVTAAGTAGTTNPVSNVTVRIVLS